MHDIGCLKLLIIVRQAVSSIYTWCFINPIEVCPLKELNLDLSPQVGWSR